jgi:hypothetical protein
MEVNTTLTEGDVPAFVPDSMRRKHENPLNLTQDQLDLKGEELARLQMLYPDVDPYWADIILDMCLTKTQKEIDEIKARIGPFTRDYSNLQNELNKVKDNYASYSSTVGAYRKEN